MAQGEAASVAQVRIFDVDTVGELFPAGLAFSPGANAFLVLETAKPGQVSEIVSVTPEEDRAGAVAIAAVIASPINMAFDSKANRLLLFDAVSHELIEIKAKTDGTLAPETLTRHDAHSWGVQSPQGMTVDPLSGRLFILDGTGPQLIQVDPEIGGNFDHAGISTVALQPTGLVNPRGLALDPTNSHLYVTDPAKQTLYELTQSGQVVTTSDLSELELGDLQGMVFAPSGDLTDDPLQMHLYFADSKSEQSQEASPPESVQSAQGNNQLYLPQVTGGSGNGGGRIPGRIVELSFEESSIAAAASTFTSSLVRTVNMAGWNIPSPDPSGLTYLPNSNKLMMSDGEVEETVNGITHFKGANVWEFSLSGRVSRTANISKKAPTVVPMTNEPTGVTWNPGNGHFYYSDDDARRVYDLNPGGDKLVGTSDDSWTSFSTLANGNNNNDPEGIAFDTRNKRLWVADGVNREVYQYTLAGALVNHFDVERYGVVDPESVEFRPDNGTLLVLSSSKNTPVVVETTLSGSLLQKISIAAANPIAAAGLAYAPASDGSGVKRFYIVDRGIDNNDNAKIIDGKMYEMTAPPPTASSDMIFADSFESGNLQAWSGSSTGGGDLSVKPAAALAGSQGLQAVINDNTALYLTDDKPNAEARYRVGFDFDPNSISMSSGDTHVIFQGFSGTSLVVLRVELSFSAGAYQLRTALLNDGTTWTNSSWFTISDASHAIELDWQASTGAGANNGSLTFWIDGVQKASRTGIDNDTRRIDRVRLGAVAGIDTGTRGTYYMDAFESHRETSIGAASGTALDSAEPNIWTEEEAVPEQSGAHQLFMPLIQ